mmetsp:Transcript_30448/g.30958  ORF Transcript_30448/g.30958 Transcript_30448/m.30958 type:complete len:349 (-) Transcript_30448:326-1372(-)
MFIKMNNRLRLVVFSFMPFSICLAEGHHDLHLLRHNGTHHPHPLRLGPYVADEVRNLLAKILYSPHQENYLWFMGPYLQEVQFEKRSQYYEPFNCKNLFMGRQFFPQLKIPPKEMPPELRSLYTINGKIPVQDQYSSEVQNGAKTWTWSSELIETKMKEKNTCGGYGKDECAKVISKHYQYIKDKCGAVIGSQTPWAEAALLAAGASHILTIEYSEIISEHQSLSAKTPQNYSESYLLGMAPKVDFVWVYSSIEHDGLGRYGDPLNPFGDMEAIGKIHCMLNLGGILFLAVPVGLDYVSWNVHRIYGRIRLSMLLHYWDIVDIEGPFLEIIDKNQFTEQPIFVLRKKT